jgi:hypothetical protein
LKLEDRETVIKELKKSLKIKVWRTGEMDQWLRAIAALQRTLV